MTEEKRTAKIIFTKSGGTASKNGITNRVTIPTTWVKEMGITKDDRDVTLKFENGVITIEKSNDENK